MKIIIPMAGRGTRLRPHTLTTPKPLLPVAGKPIIQHLVEDIAAIYKGGVTDIIYIIGDFGAETERNLVKIAEAQGARGHIRYQEQAQGTAHAIYCAKDFLDGEVVIAFADTLFRADFILDKEKDGVIWVKHVDDPRPFGVVKLDGNGVIQEMIEKPETPVSNLAIIGIYYIKEAAVLGAEIKHLLDNDIRHKGEFQLTDALENMKRKGARFAAGEVKDWMDCGNKQNVLETNARMLGYTAAQGYIHPDAVVENTTLVPPYHIGAGARVSSSVVGPDVAIGAGARVTGSVLADTIVRENAFVEYAVLNNTILGASSRVTNKSLSLNLGDFAEA